MIWYVWLICVRRMLLRCFLSCGDSESSARVRRHTVLGCVEGCERLRARVGGRDVSLRRFVRWVYVLGDVAAGFWIYRCGYIGEPHLQIFFTYVQRPFRGVSATANKFLSTATRVHLV